MQKNETSEEHPLITNIYFRLCEENGDPPNRREDS